MASNRTLLASHGLYALHRIPTDISYHENEINTNEMKQLSNLRINQQDCLL